MPSKPSDPVQRPKPAVGQVWRISNGVEYVIAVDGEHGVYRRVYARTPIVGAEACDKPDGIVGVSDTYVGQFAGFNVKEDE